MDSASLILTIVLSCVSILAAFGKIVFDYATVKSQLSGISSLLIKIEHMIEGHSRRFDDMDNRHDLLNNRLTIIETQHQNYHDKR